MIKYYYRNVKDAKMQEITDFRVGCWIDVQNPVDKELDKLAAKLHLESGHLHDAMDLHEVPRLETENGTTYIFTRFPHGDGESITTSPILIIIAETFIATISPKTPFFIQRLQERKQYFTTQKVKLMLQIISEINTSYNYYLNQISKQIRSAEVKLEKISNKDIIQFVAIEGVVNDFRP